MCRCEENVKVHPGIASSDPDWVINQALAYMRGEVIMAISHPLIRKIAEFSRLGRGSGGVCPHCGKSTKPQTYGEKVAEESIEPGDTSNYARLVDSDGTFDVCSTSMRSGLENKLKLFLARAIDEAFEAGRKTENPLRLSD